MFQVCLAHWNNKCLQLVWIHRAGTEEACEDLVWPKPHHRWKAKSNSQEQNKNKENRPLKMSVIIIIRAALPCVQIIIVMWLVQVLLKNLHCNNVLEKLLKVGHPGSKMCRCGHDEYYTFAVWICRLNSEKVPRCISIGTVHIWNYPFLDMLTSCNALAEATKCCYFFLQTSTSLE